MRSLTSLLAILIVSPGSSLVHLPPAFLPVQLLAAAEMRELPPPYVPVVVSVALAAGVGVLTQSLGDVVAEEAGLGDRSGARAKKEMERRDRRFLGKRD